MGVPTVASQDQQHLCSARTQVQSLAGPQHSGLKDPALLQLRLRSDPLARNSICCRAAKKKKKKRNITKLLMITISGRWHHWSFLFLFLCLLIFLLQLLSIML